MGHFVSIYVHVFEGSVYTFHYSLERICGTQDAMITGPGGLSGYTVFSLKAGKNPRDELITPMTAGTIL